MKAIRTIVLAVVMCLSVLITPAHAANADNFDLGSITFAKDSAKLTKALKAELNTMISNSSTTYDTITVTGYDPKGGKTKLAKKRADAIVAYFKKNGFTGTITAVGANSTTKSAKNVLSRKAVISTSRAAFAVSGKLEIVTSDNTACDNYAISSVSFDGTLRDYQATIGTETLGSGYCTMLWSLPTIVSGNYSVTLNVSCSIADKCERLRDYKGSGGTYDTDASLTVPMRGTTAQYNTVATVQSTSPFEVAGADLTGTNDYTTASHSMLNVKLVLDAYPQ